MISWILVVTCSIMSALTVAVRVVTAPQSAAVDVARLSMASVIGLLKYSLLSALFA